MQELKVKRVRVPSLKEILYFVLTLLVTQCAPAFGLGHICKTPLALKHYFGQFKKCFHRQCVRFCFFFLTALLL